MTNKVPLAAVPLKYDVLNRRLLMRPVSRPNDSLQLDDKLVAGFEIEEPADGLSPARRRLFRRFSEAATPAQRADYVEVLHEGNYVLLKHYDKTLRKANFQGAYSSGQRYDEIEDKLTYYLRRPDGSLTPVKLVAKAMQTAAPALAATLKSTPDAEKAKTEADWVKLWATIDKK
ncbi:hypothetical protein [Hymenobacter metallicola]|uniref:Uncharacterized protein n=1 Tax=Hymenobacter metallicola TaxID=2563114 RepID=A0A4Z0QGB4_9BACT|nr:hypothetical protein [Hymenobacter metallicola]TGE29098.1 hypothetical protein E5K02_06480 [Hymenobacter metallicola]